VSGRWWVKSIAIVYARKALGRAGREKRTLTRVSLDTKGGGPFWGLLINILFKGLKGREVATVWREKGQTKSQGEIKKKRGGKSQEKGGRGGGGGEAK